MWSGYPPGDADAMRPLVPPPLALLALSGCLIDRSAIGVGEAVGGLDAFLDPSVDASLVAPRPPDASLDAWLDPRFDAWAPDAFVPPPDAWVSDAWAADAWAPDAFRCTPRCDGATLVACDGTRTPCVACGTSVAVGEPHCLALVPSNTPPGYAVSTDRSAIEAVFPADSFQWDTSRCRREDLRIGSRQFHDSQVRIATVGGVEVCIVGARRFELDPGTRLYVEGSLPLVLVASESFVLPSGAIVDVSSFNEPGDCSRTAQVGPGARSSGSGAGGDGRAATAEFGDGGGGGGGFCGLGGAGGMGNLVSGAAGGGRVGGPSVALAGGFPGGRGSPDSRGGAGGAGGGALQISAPRITFGGVIDARGQSGRGGAETASGGGGGSGGAVLLEALVLEASAGLIDVRGGGGGGGADLDSGAMCGGIEPAPGPQTGGAGASRGGDGAGGSAVDGAAGGSGYNGGGGGGGAGCVVIRQAGAAEGPDTAPSAVGVVATSPPEVR